MANETSIRQLPFKADEKREWQIKLFIFEARNLEGYDLYPVCGISLLTSRQFTQPCTSTANPIWNRSLQLAVKSTAVELFASSLIITVYHSRTFRSDSAIGEARVNVSALYESTQHSLINKWLALRGGSSKSGYHKGYIRLSICLVIPGESVPDLSAQYLSSDDTGEILEFDPVDKSDVEVYCHIYRAEDLPRMDMGFGGSLKDKWRGMFGSSVKAPPAHHINDLVDPCLQIRLAGKTLKTKVITGCDHPVWNETVKIALQVPTFADNIKLELMDWDRMSADDHIATLYLNLQDISEQGLTGCLPTLGPCYLNFYGSEREFNTRNPHALAMNRGEKDGAAFRGRALVHISSRPVTRPVSEVIQCSPNERFLQPYTDRKEYRLLAVFMSASILKSISEPVAFEVSIGNYGNCLDKNMMTAASATLSTFPPQLAGDSNVRVGGDMPWISRKPCCVVDSLWEDCEHRLMCINLILKLSSFIEQALEELDSKVRAQFDINIVTHLIVETLDKISCQLKDLESELRKFCGTNSCVFTDLDYLIMERRSTTLESVQSQVTDILRTATVIEDTIEDIRKLKCSLDKLATDPQVSIPDIVISMLIGGQRRAYCRVPAYEVFKTTDMKTSGRFCNQTQLWNMKEPGVDVQSLAVVRCRLWLGRKDMQSSWFDKQKESGQFGVYAECYENQVYKSGSWVAKGLPIPAFSDIQGKVALPKDNFTPPVGCKWDGEWKISTDLHLNKVDNKHPITEIIYKWQERSGDSWTGAATWYTNTTLERLAEGLETIHLPPNWAWKSDWLIDRRPSTDNDGWEYCDNSDCTQFTHLVRNRHKIRRVRLSRVRSYRPPTNQVVLQNSSKAPDSSSEGWEFSNSYSTGFHHPQQAKDKLRRRQWSRKLSCGGSSRDLALFDVKSEEGSAINKVHKAAPRIYIKYSQSYEYELRAYIYKARGVVAGDVTGLSDVFVRVRILHHSLQTRTIDASLSPCWDETLMFNNIQIFGHPALHMVHEPIQVLVQLFDQDEKDEEYLGEFTVKPTMAVSSSFSSTKSLTPLRWFPIRYGLEKGGQLLGAFELYLKDKNHRLLPPATVRGYYSIPRHIKPTTEPVHIEILCWGLRLLPDSKPSLSTPTVEFESDGNTVRSSTLTKQNKTLNFDNARLVLETNLCTESAYISPMNIKLLQSGTKSKDTKYLAVCEINNLSAYLHDPVRSDTPNLPDVNEDDLRMDVALNKLGAHGNGLSMFDWWSKFFASSGEYTKCGSYLKLGIPGGLIKVYKTELEKVAGHENFNDLLVSFPLIAGKEINNQTQTVVAHLKGNVKVHKLADHERAPSACEPKYLYESLPSRSQLKCIVRVYCVRAFGLQPSDFNGLADPYIQIQVGGLNINNRKEFLANTLEPVFGRMFELTCAIPQMRLLTIRVVDRDVGSADDLIGETTIDLENRLFSKYRAKCGISQMYIMSGIFQWRDSQKPTDILVDYSSKRSVGPVKFYGDIGVRIANRHYNIGDFENDHRSASAIFGNVRERLALHILNKTDLVTEHVETRALYSPAQPGVEQGKLQMWVDIFPESEGPPGPPVDITPRKPQKYEMRVVIHDTLDVQPADRSLFGGSDTSDIYVKAWIKGTTDIQETDVHYRAQNGEGNFNWRFVFSMEYFSTEQFIIVTTKKVLNMNATQRKLPPILTVQVWDNDTLTADDFIGSLEIHLDQMKMPLKALPYFKSKFDAAYNDRNTINLFEHRKIRGYFPVFGPSLKSNDRIVTGKVDMTLEILPHLEALANSAGKGREQPQGLTYPLRSSDSFPWYQNPWKSLLIFIRNRKKKCCCCVCLLIVIFIIVLGFVSLPRVVLEKVIPNAVVPSNT